MFQFAIDAITSMRDVNDGQIEAIFLSNWALQNMKLDEVA